LAVDALVCPQCLFDATQAMSRLAGLLPKA